MVTGKGGLALGLVIFFLLTSLGCRKLPLEEDWGVIDTAKTYWFEDEKLVYVFFSLGEREGRLQDFVWELSYSSDNAGGGEDFVDFEVMDLDKGFHQHEYVACGPDRLCGSFSFHHEHRLLRAHLRFRYDRSSDLGLTVASELQNVKGPSAKLYGTFDRTNSEVQMRVYDDFPLGPDDREIALYGMTRKFRVSELKETDLALDAVNALQEEQEHPFLFPAGFCGEERVASEGSIFSDKRYWLPSTLVADHNLNGFCLTTEFLSHEEVPYYWGKAVARKNPELSAFNLLVKTPLRDVVKIPLVVQYCPNTRFSTRLTDDDFFQYQRFVMNIEQREYDLCIEIGNDQEFSAALRNLVAEKLAAARATTSGKDFMFVVIWHERLNKEFFSFHRILADTLYEAIHNEINIYSPHLVGAMIYATSADFKLSAQQSRFMIWCPQERPSEFVDPQTDSSDVNCTTLPAGEFKSNILSFKVPLGPFPTLTTYRAYVDKHGDKGLSKEPELAFYAPQTSETSVIKEEVRTTYFDDRLEVGPGESVRACLGEQDSDVLTSMRFRKLTNAPDVEEEDLGIEGVEPLWLDPEQSAGTYKIGVAWEVPFWGGLRYKQTVHGKIVSIVPFQKSFRQYHSLGDRKWTAQEWRLDDIFQFCRKYCDHPFFDDEGNYQIQTTWRSNRSFTCPRPLLPRRTEP